MSLKYDIGRIGWFNFESLVQTLLKEIIGRGVTSFGGSKDGGRDATFLGIADYPSKQTRWDGFWVFQVKYSDLERGTDQARKCITNSIKNEMKGILARNSRKSFSDNYILITNVPLTAADRDSINQDVINIGFSGNFKTIDGKEVCEFLDLFPHVRWSYPQLLGLGDLDHVINRELYERSEAYVRYWQPKLSTFVHTTTYGQAINKLRSNYFIVLDGPPETGKSTIAAALALSYTIKGYAVIDIRNPDQIFQIYNGSHQQIYIADDAIGSISLDPSLSDQWSRDLSGIFHKLDDRHLLIWTTRTYILEKALSDTRLGETGHGFPDKQEIIVEVGKLSLNEKAEILYNHAKFAQLSTKSRELIRKHEDLDVESQ